MAEGTTQTPFILVDGSSYLYRAFHALPPLVNSKGQPTGAVYGVINMLKKMLVEYQPKHIAVVFDAKGKTFRDEMYSEYKANRPPMLNDLRSQIEPLHSIIKAMGLPLIAIEGVEADDVIATLALDAEKKGLKTLISTGDKDMAQIVSSSIELINTMTGKSLDPVGVEEKFGVQPSQIVDYLALMGDSVDNVPGVPKVGPKTAAKWLQQYGTLENLITHADEIKGKVGENFRAAKEQLPLSKSLVSLKTDVDLAFEIDDLILTDKDKPALTEWFGELEFKTWLQELLQEGEGVNTNTETLNNQWVLIDKESDFKGWLVKLNDAELIIFDTETTSLNTLQAQLVGLSFAIANEAPVYIPVGHDYDGAPQQLDRQWVLQQLKPFFEDANIKKAGHNLKYDMNILAQYDIHLRGIAYDTLLESYVLNSTGSRHDMDTLALKYLKRNTIHFEDIAGKGAKQKTFNQIALEEAGPYAAEDAEITLQLHNTLWPQVLETSALANVFTDIELPLVSVLARMERAGVLIDAKLLSQQSEELAKKITELEQQAYEQAGENFNLSSPKQLQEILFNKMGLPIIKKTPKGQPSTAEDVLQELAHDHELPALILSYRSLSKLKSTYTDKLPEQVEPNTGRVHTSYHQAVTATGRLSSSDPNLQNIPIRTDEGRRIRNAFIAPKGHKIIAADYSQIELRIMAHLSNDPGLQKAFANDLDVHKATAAEVFAVPFDEVTDEQRRRAKAINFGLIYGMSAFGLAKQLEVERYEAQEYMDVYFHRYPGVQTYMEQTREQAKKQGYVETVFGRRLYLPDINASNMMRRKAAERAAINAPMQGTAADIIKRAMIRIDACLNQQDALDATMVMQVHDELVFEVAENDVEGLEALVRQEMMQAAELSVPLLVDVGIGNNWQEAH